MTTVEINSFDEPAIQDFSIQLGVQKFLESMDRVLGKKGANQADKGGQGGLITIQLLNGLISSLQLSTNHLSAHNILEHFGECKEAMGLSTSALEPVDKSASESALQVLAAPDTCPNFHPKETRLLYSLQLISEEKFGAALLFLTGEGDVENGAPAISVLLSGLKTILEHICSENCDLKSLSSFMEPLEKPFVDVFTRISIFSLMKLNLKNKAEALLYKISDWKQSEDDNDKSVIPTMAFNVANSYLTNASPKLITHLMERIAESDPANPVALELCRKYLEAEMAQSMAGSDCETPDVKLDYLSRSLELTMLYVDEQSPSLTPALAGSINQAWEILAETLRRICTRGSEVSISNLINLWHKGRKAWWPYQHFRNPANIRTSAEAVMLTNKAFCCYLLETENHPFVVSRKKTAPLSGLIAQLRPDKIIHDERVDATLSRMDYFKASKLFFQSQEPPRLPKESSDFFTSTPSHIIREEEMSPLDGFMSPTSLEDDALRLPQSDQSCYESAEEDAPYIPINPSFGLEKAETSWSERLRSNGSLEAFSELCESIKETDEEEMSAQPLWLHRSESEMPGDWSEKAERWKEFIATGIWKELPDDPVLHDDSTGSEMEIGSNSDDRDSPTTDDCWEDETWLAKKFPSAFQPQVHQDQDSQPPLTPALSSIMACSPRLETSPKEVIPNRDRLPCFEFSENETSLHNSTAEEIAHSISMIVKKLEDGPEGVPVEKELDDDVIVLETEPEPHHTEPFPNLTRSSELNVSSPDMFISPTSDEEGEGNKAEEKSVPAPTPSRLVVLDTSSEEDSSDMSSDTEEARPQPTTSTPIFSPQRKRRRLSSSLLRLKIKRMSPKKSPGSCKRSNKRRSMWQVSELGKKNEQRVDQLLEEDSMSNAGLKPARKTHTRVRNSAFWSSDSEDETAAAPSEKKDEEPCLPQNNEEANEERPDPAQMIEDILAMCRMPSVVKKVPKKKKEKKKKMFITADAQMDLLQKLLAEKAPQNQVDAEKPTKKKKSTKS